MTTKKSQANKDTLLRLAREGGLKPRSVSKLGRALADYCDVNGSSYDAEFKKEIVAERSDWFENTTDKKKAIILAMAKEGKDKKALRGPLLTAFRNYTNPSTSGYDRIFTLLIQEVAPLWLVKRPRGKRKGPSEEGPDT